MIHCVMFQSERSYTEGEYMARSDFYAPGEGKFYLRYS